MDAALIVAGIAVLIALVAVRSRRKGSASRARGGWASGMARSGMLEMQALLQPERKVEILAKGEFDEVDQIGAEDPPEPPPGKNGDA